MVGTFPRLQSWLAVRFGEYPTTQTVVYRHTPRVPRWRSDGMRLLDNRKLVLRCYKGSKNFVFPNIGTAT